MFHTPNFDEFARHVVDFYRGRPVVLQPFEYQMPTTGVIANGATTPVSVKVAGNADFWMYELDWYTDNFSAFLYGQLIDTGSQELLSIGANLANYTKAYEFGRFVAPSSSVPNIAGVLPIPKRFASNSTVTISWTNDGSAPGISAVYSVIRGVLAFEQG